MWNKSLSSLTGFNFHLAALFFKRNGATPRQESKGYKYYVEEYIHDVWVDNLTVKGKCYPSQRKNGKPHDLIIVFVKQTLIGSDNLVIEDCRCSCDIGQSLSCHHLMGLAYYLQNLVYTETTIIPDDDISKTSKPMEWNKPRGRKILPEPLTSMTFYNPTNVKRKKKPISSTFFPVNTSYCEDDGVKIEKLVGDLKKQTGDSGQKLLFTYLFNPNKDETLTTISIQNMNVVENSVEMDIECVDEANSGISLPVIDNELCNIFNLLPIVFVDSSPTTFEDSAKIETETRRQSESEMWHTYRVQRFTASRFGELCKRRKEVDLPYFTKLWEKKNLHHLPAIRHGLKYEGEAKNAYKEKTGNKVFPAGFIIHPYAPNLGASPDGVVFDARSHQHGLLEVKCPYSKKFQSLQESLEVKDFCLRKSENNGELKTTHEYYFQVQGQMLITGLRWCDFCIYFQNRKEIFIERITFDAAFCTQMYEKLTFMYKKYQDLL